MKRWIGWAAIIACVIFLLQMKRTDVGQLRPVELIYIYKENDAIVFETDTEDIGRGKDLFEAMSDLKQTTSGEIFLDTADYVLVTEESKAMLPECTAFLRPAVEVCIAEGEIDLGEAARYLSSHSSKTTLQMLRNEKTRIPVLKVLEGRFRIE